MNVFGDSGQIDSTKFLDYVARQLPADIATLVKTRDELALRQGALTAAEDAAKMRDDAKAALAAAQEQAKTLVADAKTKVADAKAKQDALTAKIAAHEQAVAAFNSESTAKWSDLATARRTPRCARMRWPRRRQTSRRSKRNWPPTAPTLTLASRRSKTR